MRQIGVGTLPASRRHLYDSTDIARAVRVAEATQAGLRDAISGGGAAGVPANAARAYVHTGTLEGLTAALQARPGRLRAVALPSIMTGIAGPRERSVYIDVGNMHVGGTASPARKGPAPPARKGTVVVSATHESDTVVHLTVLAFARTRGVRTKKPWSASALGALYVAATAVLEAYPDDEDLTLYLKFTHVLTLQSSAATDYYVGTVHALFDALRAYNYYTSYVMRNDRTGAYEFVLQQYVRDTLPAVHPMTSSRVPGTLRGKLWEWDAEQPAEGVRASRARGGGGGGVSATVRGLAGVRALSDGVLLAEGAVDGGGSLPASRLRREIVFGVRT